MLKHSFFNWICWSYDDTFSEETCELFLMVLTDSFHKIDLKHTTQ